MVYRDSAHKNKNNKQYKIHNEILYCKESSNNSSNINNRTNTIARIENLLKEYKNEILFIPLGGSKEIGMNCNLYHINGRWIMVDCGAGFAEDSTPGVKILVPDISFVIDYLQNKLDAVIITHMHQDHIGGYSYLCKWLRCPVYTTEFAANFLKNKLVDSIKDAKVLKQKLENIYIVKAGQELNISEFKIELIELNHSAPEMQALLIKTPKGNIFHSGDWKKDHNPVIGVKQKLDVFKRIGDKNILALVCDSTNIFSHGTAGSEGDLQESLRSIIRKTKNRVFVTTFASNLARIYSIALIAKEVGRSVVLAGRSFNNIIDSALKTKSIKLSNGSNIEHPFKDMKFYNETHASSIKDKNKILILATGCQGEEMAALSKIARTNHPNIAIESGDNIIFSSKTIPGNEKKVARLQNKLINLNINLFIDKKEFVHVSGHPSRDDLADMYKGLNPTIAVPVHGESIHLKEHAIYARELGVKYSIPPTNGDIILLNEDSPRKLGVKVFNGYYGVEGARLINLKSSIIYEREKLSYGMIVVNLVYKEGICIKDPNIQFFGCYLQYETRMISGIQGAVLNNNHLYKSLSIITTSIDNKKINEKKLKDVILNKIRMIYDLGKQDKMPMIVINTIT